MVNSMSQERILAFIQEQKLFRAGDKVIVGVSGGKDSVALLHLLFNLRHQLGITLSVAHYNHALRRSSVRDQEFVQDLALRMGVPFFTETNRVRLPSNVSVEEFARERRYGFLRRAVRSSRADSVALAHTRDDLAETVLMRILRGTGLSGLRAMLPKRELNGMIIIRPFLAISRREIDSYIKDNRLRWIEDPSNRSLEFFRNVVRLKLIPYLERNAGLGVKSNLANLASIAASDYDLIEVHAVDLFKTLAEKRGRGVVFPINKIVILHSALRRTLFRLAIEEIKGDLNAIGYEHLTAVERLSLRGKSGMTLVLPKGILVKRSNVNIVLFRR